MHPGENAFESGNYTPLKILVTAKAPENWMSKQDDPRTLWGLANISEASGSAFIRFFFLKAQNLARSAECGEFKSSWALNEDKDVFLPQKTYHDDVPLPAMLEILQKSYKVAP